MNTTTATATTPAQVGKGRTVHQVPAGEMVTLCGSNATSLLTATEAQSKKGKVCAKCTKIAALRTAAVAEASALEEAPAEAAPAVERAPEYRTLKGVGAAGAFQMYGEVREVRGKLVFTSWGNSKQLKGEPHTFTRQWTERGGYRYLEDAEGCTVEFNGGVATKVWVVDGVPAPAPAADVAEQAAEAPAVDEAPREAPAVDDAPAEPAEVEEAPQADDTPAEAAELVQVTAYTAARDALHINGKDSDDRTLTLPASALQEAVAAMRRMPRWNAAEERFTVNKVALIVAQDAQGQRVWVRGEAAPIRVNFAGEPIAEDAPAEAGAVDMAAVLAATRVLRRRAEVQRVIDNRNAARASSA
jgi:hypothetical protein